MIVTKLNTFDIERVTMKCKIHPLEDLEYFIPFKIRSSSNKNHEVLLCSFCLRENNEFSDSISLKSMMRSNKEEVLKSTIYVFNDNERKYI